MIVLRTHEEVLVIAQRAKNDVAKKAVTDSFLASLSSNKLEWRSGLSAYDIMQSFPDHNFEPYSEENNKICKICCSSGKENVNKSFLNYGRYKTGGLVLYYIYEIAFFLQQQALLPEVEPQEEDFFIFSQILTLLEQAGAKDTPATIQKKAASN